MSVTRTRRPAGETREHILRVAHDLFYWEGIRATGVDRIAAEAAIGPTTLYRLFASKDDLVAAYVQRNDEQYRAWVSAVTAPEVGSPRDRILALFDALIEQVQPDVCRGCPFLMALAEFPDPQSPVHRNAAATKAWVRDRLHDLVVEFDAATPVLDPDALADQLMLLMEGVYGSVQALTVAGPAMQARAAADALLTAARRTDA